MINNQQRHAVLTQLTRNRAKNRLSCSSRIEEFVRLFNGDHQLTRFVDRVLGAQEGFGLFDPATVDAARDDIRRQHIRQRAAVLPELEHHMLPACQMLDQAIKFPSVDA